MNAVTESDAIQSKIFDAIAVQRPVVMSYLRSLRRDKPDADIGKLIQELDNRYIATVTVASSGVGASAAIPGVGIPLALGLGVADMLFFYETSALYVLAIAELHGCNVDDVERARPLVLGTLLGEKSQAAVSTIVMTAMGAGAVEQARKTASSAVSSVVPKGWGELLFDNIPVSALAPLTVVMRRQALASVGKMGSTTLGKAIPFGVGAVIGGVGSYYFGKDVVKSSRKAFTVAPKSFPEWLEDFERSDEDIEPSRAQKAMQAASENVKNFGEDAWGAAITATDWFRSVDLDGDGVADEARALTVAKTAGASVVSVAGKASQKASSLFKKK